MAPVNRHGVDWKFPLFAVLWTIFAIVILSLAEWVLSFVLSGGELPAGSFRFNMVLIAVPAILALPVTLPLGLIAWSGFHWGLFEISSKKRRVYTAAAMFGFGSCIGFLLAPGVMSTIWFGDLVENALLVFSLVLIVIVAALVSARIVYFSFGNEIEL